MLTVLVLTGIRRSNLANIAIASVTLASLTLFVIAGLPHAPSDGGKHLQPFFGAAPSGSALSGLLEACALMFVAYTGYGRIATLGEEIHRPHEARPLLFLTWMPASRIVFSKPLS